MSDEKITLGKSKITIEGDVRFGRTTIEDVKDYVRSLGTHCVFCGSHDVEASDFDGEGCYQKAWCNTCGKEWRDVYKLCGVNVDGTDIIIEGEA